MPRCFPRVFLRLQQAGGGQVLIYKAKRMFYSEIIRKNKGMGKRMTEFEEFQKVIARLRAPDGWLVAYESETVDGASVVTRITLTTPPVETVILLR